jgi:uncharacterized Zn-binding protein involved in type VI secretion
MSQLVIVLGDKTTHGGTVITATASTDTLGKPWARVGDQVACKKCRGIYPIAEGDPSLIEDGKAVAYHGCKVACGAMLIGGPQFLTTTSPSHGIGSTATALLDGFGAVDDGKAAAYEDEPVDEDEKRWRGRFRIVDDATRTPIAGEAVRVQVTDGRVLGGTTDADGYTQWVERDASVSLSLELLGGAQERE